VRSFFFLGLGVGRIRVCDVNNGLLFHGDVGSTSGASSASSRSGGSNGGNRGGILVHEEGLLGVFELYLVGLSLFSSLTGSMLSSLSLGLEVGDLLLVSLLHGGHALVVLGFKGLALLFVDGMLLCDLLCVGLLLDLESSSGFSIGLLEGKFGLLGSKLGNLGGMSSILFLLLLQRGLHVLIMGSLHGSGFLSGLGLSISSSLVRFSLGGFGLLISIRDGGFTSSFSSGMVGLSLDKLLGQRIGSASRLKEGSVVCCLDLDSGVNVLIVEVLELGLGSVMPGIRNVDLNVSTARIGSGVVGVGTADLVVDRDAESASFELKSDLGPFTHGESGARIAAIVHIARSSLTDVHPGGVVEEPDSGDSATMRSVVSVVSGDVEDVRPSTCETSRLDVEGHVVVLVSSHGLPDLRLGAGEGCLRLADRVSLVVVARKIVPFVALEHLDAIFTIAPVVRLVLVPRSPLV